MFAAHLECDALRYAALCMDIGMRDPSDDFLPDSMLGLTRWRHDAAPDSRGMDPDHDLRFKICRYLVHEHRQNRVHFPDHREVRSWAVDRGQWIDAGDDVLSRGQFGTGPNGWAAPATPGA
eukprot:7815447-Pyramimonas_sp.AAC.1